MIVSVNGTKLVLSFLIMSMHVACFRIHAHAVGSRQYVVMLRDQTVRAPIGECSYSSTTYHLLDLYCTNKNMSSINKCSVRYEEGDFKVLKHCYIQIYLSSPFYCAIEKLLI